MQSLFLSLNIFPLLLFFFLYNFLLTLLERVIEREREREKQREMSSIHWLNIQMAAISRVLSVWTQESEVSFRSHTWMQEPKDLGHSLLFFQATSRMLNVKWSSQDLNQCPHGILVLQAEQKLPIPRYWPKAMFWSCYHVHHMKNANLMVALYLFMYNKIIFPSNFICHDTI